MLTFKKTVATNDDDYKKAIEQLNNNINEIAKNITYLDVYNIVDSVEQPENFSSQVNALAPNSSLVINTDSFAKDGVSYSRGDVILKNANSTVVHIKSQTGGVYFPIRVEKDQDYNIVYSYQGTKPAPGQVETRLDEDAGFSETISFKGFTFEKNTNYVYGLWQPASKPFSKFKTSDGRVVQPYIKFYTIKKNFKIEYWILE